MSEIDTPLGREVPPALPLRLTLAGLIPFVLSAGAFLYGDYQREALAGNFSEADEALMQAYAQASALAAFGLQSLFFYSAAILSFLGGARWGMELRRAPDKPDDMTLILSLFPAIIAWVSLLIAFRPGIALVMLAGAFGACLFWDLSASKQGDAPAWYKTPRSMATFGAVLCLVLAFARVSEIF